MHSTHRRRGIGLVAAGALALGVVLTTACGGSDKPKDSPTSQEQQPAATASVVVGATAASQPQALSKAATAAPQSAASLGGLPSSKSCLIGDWEVQDLQGYMSSLLSQGSNRVSSVTGTMRMTARPDGTITENVSKVTITTVTGPSTMAVTMDGNVTATYSENNGQLTFTSIGGNLTTSATLDGKQMLAPTNAVDNSFFGTENSHIDYQCKGDTLTFPLNIPNRESVALTFRRAR
jgi:hypothetical protein